MAVLTSLIEAHPISLTRHDDYSARWRFILIALLLLCVAGPFVFGLPWLGYLSGSDSDFALQLVTGYAEQMRAGHLFPQWLPGANSGFGSPVFYFYGRVPFLVASIIALVLRVSASTSLVLAMILFRGLAFWTCRLWLRLWLPLWAADLGALVFVCLPFAMTANPVTRVGYAEVAATALIPLLLWAVDRSSRGWQRGCLDAALLGLFYALLAMTHLPQLLLAIGFVTLYTLVRGSARAVLLHLAGAAAGLLSACAFLLPAVLTRNLINTAGWTDNPYVDIRNNFLFTLSRFRLYKTFDLDLCLYATWFLCLGIVLWCYRSGRRSRTSGSPVQRSAVVCLVVGLLAMTPLTKPIWLHVEHLRTLQFPWRVFPVVLAFTALVSGSIAQKSRSWRHLLLAGAGLLIAVQLIFAYAGAFLSLSGFTRTHHVSQQVVRRLPAFVWPKLRDTPAVAGRWSAVPEYLPKQAVQSGWDVDAYRYGVLLHGKTYPAEPTRVPGLTIARDGRGDLTCDGTLPSPADLRLPVFYYPDERAVGAPGVSVQADAATGLARISAPAGRIHMKLQHAAPVAGETFGRVLSGVGCSLLCILFALGVCGQAVDLPSGRGVPATSSSLSGSYGSLIDPVSGKKI